MLHAQLSADTDARFEDGGSKMHRNGWYPVATLHGVTTQITLI